MAVAAPIRQRSSLLLVFPALFLAIGLVQLALVRKQVVEWQTLTGAGLFGIGLLVAAVWLRVRLPRADPLDRKSTRLNSSHGSISYAGFCLKKKKKMYHERVVKKLKKYYL